MTSHPQLIPNFLVVHTYVATQKYPFTMLLLTLHFYTQCGFVYHKTQTSHFFIPRVFCSAWYTYTIIFQDAKPSGAYRFLIQKGIA